MTALESEKQTRRLEKELFSWSAPVRPFKRRNREYYITLISMAGVVGLVMFLAEGWIPVVLLSSLIFLFYILNTVEPENITYKITDRGIKLDTTTTPWEIIIRYWFTRRYDHSLLVFQTGVVPGRVEFVINPEQKEEIRKILKKYIPEEEAPASFLDKTANWVGEKLPGNKHP